LLKFLRQEYRYRFITSGSLLGITLRSTTSIPVGSIIRKEMFQLDFEEFLVANRFGTDAIAVLREKFHRKESLGEEQHRKVMDLFRRYLLVGGMPDTVNEYLFSHNIVKVREVQESIRMMYGDDASKYEQDNGCNLLIRRIDDYSNLSILPIEVKSDKDYAIHSALNNLLSVKDYHLLSGLVLSNNRKVTTRDKVTYIPIYYVMFLDSTGQNKEDIFF